jgi:hypothetical protein
MAWSRESLATGLVLMLLGLGGGASWWWVSRERAHAPCPAGQGLRLQADGTERCEEPLVIEDREDQRVLPVPTVQPGQALVYRPLTTEADEWQCLALTIPTSSPWTCDRTYRQQLEALYDTSHSFTLTSLYHVMALVHDAQGRPLTLYQDDIRLLFAMQERTH